ncbi:MAG: RNA polymerase Rpb4 family protein [Candidatus Aenigmatarchaeota archaeon]
MPVVRALPQDSAARQEHTEETPAQIVLKTLSDYDFQGIIMKVVAVKPIPMAEAKEILEKREKGKELGYEQKLAAEHLKKFTKLKPAEAKKLVEELNAVLRMSPETLATLVNVLPQNKDELRLIFAREKFSLKEEEIAKILETVKKYS